MNNWPKIIREAMREGKATQRQLEAVSGMPRTTMKRVLKGETPIRIDHLESVLASLGYSLIIQKTGEADPNLRRKHKPRERKGGPILSKLIKAAGMGVHY